MVFKMAVAENVLENTKKTDSNTVFWKEIEKKEGLVLVFKDALSRMSEIMRDANWIIR